MDNLKKLIKSYETWVAANPETVCDVETTTKWVSYFIAGRISDSNVVSELIYTLSNMLVLYNDRIIDKSNGLQSVNFDASTSAVAYKNNKNLQYVHRLKVILTTLEYCEVFIEISAKRIFGVKGKWLFVSLVQFAKAAGRFFILQHSTEQIITTPALPALNRRALLKKQKNALKNGYVNKNSSTESGYLHANGFGDSSGTFQLKRSGRMMRKVEGAPPLQYRDFKLGGGQPKEIGNYPLNRALIQAEYLYIAKPLIHLAAMGVFGERKWKQYVVSLTLDLISIRMYHQHRHEMSKEQKLELSRRCINLLLYLVRSPLYDNVTHSRIDRVLGFVAKNVPLIKMIAGPLREYLPYWQGTYFYLWST